MAQAKRAGKLPQDFEIAHAYRRNLPERVSQCLRPHRDVLSGFPFDSDFDEIKRVLVPALTELTEISPTLSGKLRLLLSSVTGQTHPQEGAAMARMGYEDGNSLVVRILSGALWRVAGRQ